MLVLEYAFLIFIVHGTTYVRWARKQCPNNNTELVYSGKYYHSTLNTLMNKSSALSNTLCMYVDLYMLYFLRIFIFLYHCQDFDRTWLYIWVTRWMSYKKQELSTLQNPINRFYRRKPPTWIEFEIIWCWLLLLHVRIKYFVFLKYCD